MTNTIKNFISDDKDTLYTMINLTRKVVGVGTKFENENGDIFRLACPGVTREAKLTSTQYLCPGQITDYDIIDNALHVKQWRYNSPTCQKRDHIVVFKTNSKAVQLSLQ